MNIICGKHCEQHCDGFLRDNTGYKYYNTNEYNPNTGYVSRWAKSLDLIPEPKIYSREFINKFCDEHDLMKNNTSAHRRG